MIRSILTGTGSYLPEKIMTNRDLSQLIETSDEWITERTGIKQRHIAAETESCAFMGAEAARKALENAGILPDKVDGIILATATPDQAFPATAVLVAALLNINCRFAFDISSACNGFLVALATADAMIKAGQANNVLVIGSEVYSRILNWQDRTTCVLFGDGAGAVLLQKQEVCLQNTAADKLIPGIIGVNLYTDPTQKDILYVDGAVGTGEKTTGKLIMNGREVFRHAVKALADSVEALLSSYHFTSAEIDLIIPHQANLRIINNVGQRLGLPPEKIIVTVDRHANTSSASVPLALDEARQLNKLKPGQLIVLEAFGGGLNWGSALIRL